MQRWLVRLVAAAAYVWGAVAGVVAAPESTPERSDWAQFRGPRGAGVAVGRAAPVKWGPAENIRWRTELPGAGASSPVLAGGRIFLTSYSGYGVPGAGDGDIRQLKRHVLCFDRDTGRLLWSRDVAARQPEEERVREDHGYATSTPAADDRSVYVFLGKSGVYAFDHDGRQLWKADVGSRTNGWGSAASPVIAGDLLIVNASVESESIVALDRGTGAPAWRADGIRDAWNAPILVDVPGGSPPRELVVAMFQKLVGLDPGTGARLWSCDTGINWYMVPGLVADADGVVYCIGGRSGGALAVRAGGRGDVTASHRLWAGTRGSNVSSPVLSDGYLYWAHENRGEVYCARANTGEIVYERLLDRAGQIYASPVLSGGNLYYPTRDGRFFVVAAAPEFKLVSSNELERRGTFNASPAVVQGRLYVRSNRYLYCIGED
jgi:hypothetical protein